MEVVRAAVKLGAGAHKAVAVISGENSYSYAQLLRSAVEVSKNLQRLWLSTDPGSKPVEKYSHGYDGNRNAARALGGARVGIMAAPCAEFVAGMWGTWLSGGVVVPLALSHPETELLHVLTDANIAMVITTQDYRNLIEGASERCSAPLCILPSLEAGNQDGYSAEKQPTTEDIEPLLPVAGEEEVGLIVYTSGTTGKPKGAVHTHAGMGAQVAMLTEAWEYSADDCFLHCLPLHHVHGLFNALLAPLYAGATVHFMPKFSVSGVWQKWRESYSGEGELAPKPITCFTGVPTMYVRLLQGFGNMDPSSQQLSAAAARKLRLMMSGSSALPLPVMSQWEKVTGHRLLERYGMTEFVMALSNPLHGERKAGTVGKPLPGVEFKIIQDDNEPGTGELCLKSPSMFKEYWKKPEVTKSSFGTDGYFKTGDYVTVDSDGYIQILGRTSVDIIKFGGYKLSALEIESVLLEHPEIAECAVLGLPSQEYGEIVSLVVIANANADITLESLREWALQKLAPYKVPQIVRVWKTLPRNAMGKVNKKELKQILLTK